MSDSREVVITGVGIVSPIGIGKDAFWASLRERRSGVGPLQLLKDAQLPAPFGGELTNFEPKNYVQPRKSLKVMCREIQAGFSASAMAMADAGITAPVTDPDRFGVVIGSEMFYCAVDEMEDVYRNCIVDGSPDRLRELRQQLVHLKRLAADEDHDCRESAEGLCCRECTGWNGEVHVDLLDGFDFVDLENVERTRRAASRHRVDDDETIARRE